MTPEQLKAFGISHEQIAGDIEEERKFMLPTPNFPKSPEENLLPILELLLRPRNALAIGTKNLLDGTGSFWSGVKEGLKGAPEVHWSDVVGMERAKPNQPTAEWLGRQAAMWIPDMLLDPLWGVGKLGQAARVSKPWAAASRAILGSPLGRIVHRAPYAELESFELPFLSALRARGEGMSDVLSRVQAAQKAEQLALQDIPRAARGETRAAWREAFERPSTQREIPDIVSDAYSDLHEASAMALDRLNAARASMGLSPIERITEGQHYRWVPRIPTEKAKSLEEPGRAAESSFLQRILSPEEIKSRTLAVLADPEALAKGRFEYATGSPVVVNLKNPKNLTRAESGRWIYQSPDGKSIPVIPMQASMAEALASKAAPPNQWVPGVAESFLADVLRKENQRAYLYFLQKGLTDPEKFATTGKGWLMQAKDAQEVPQGWRRINVPGIPDLWAPKWAANKIEMRGKNLFDPNTLFGSMEQFGSAVGGTQLGKLFKDATTWWKRNVLAHPGYFMGNLISDIGLRASEIPTPLIPFRAAQAMAVQRGYDGIKGAARIFPEMPNAELAKEMAKRGIGDIGQYFEEAGGPLKEALKGGGRVRDLAEKLPGPAKYAGRAIARTGEEWGRFNDWLFRSFGQPIETNSRLSIAIDWLKRRGITKPTPEELDMAAFIANKAMIDYSGIASIPMIRHLKMLIPFYTWTHGILGRTAELVLTKPQKLANLARGLQAALDPLGPEEMKVAPDWMKESIPFKGIAGTPLNRIVKQYFGGEDSYDEPKVFLGGRFIPFTSVQGILSRPVDYLSGAISPWIKAPIELAANRSAFLGKEIDPLAPFPQNLMNPILTALGSKDAPYSLGSRNLFGKALPVAYDYLIAQSPVGRHLGATHELGRGMGLWEDPQRAQTTLPETLLWWLSGGKFYNFDKSKYARRAILGQRILRDRAISEYRRAIRKNDITGAMHYRAILQNLQQEPTAASTHVE